MGRSRYTITDDNAPHFLTFTVLNWLPVFTGPGTVRDLQLCATGRFDDNGD